MEDLIVCKLNWTVFEIKMEKTRRKSSASEFFSRRHSSSLFQSMRRYSTSTIFGAGSRSDNNGDSSGGDISTRKSGRRHSTAQLPISHNSLNSSNSSPNTASRTEKIKSLAKVVLGDVEEQQEQDCVDDSAGRDTDLNTNPFKLFSLQEYNYLHDW